MSGSMTREDFDAYGSLFCPAPFIPVRAAGSRVWDQQGKEYIDMAGGIAVNARAMLTRRWLRPCRINWRNCGISAMAIPTSRCCSWQNPRAVDLCRQGVFCNSGAEANEAALKLARKYAHDKFGGEKAKSSPSTTPSMAARCSPSPLAASRNIPAIMLRCRRALPICPITISRRSPRRSPRAPAR